MATIRQIIESCGGVANFCRKVKTPYATAQRWYSGEVSCKEWLTELLEWAILKGYDRKAELNTTELRNKYIKKKKEE